MWRTFSGQNIENWCCHTIRYLAKVSGLNTPISLSYRAGACSMTLTKEPRGVNHDLIKVEPVNITRTHRASALTMSSRATKTISLILVSSVWIIGYVRVHTTQKAWLTSGNIFYPKFNPLIHTHTQLGKRPNCGRFLRLPLSSVDNSRP